MPDLAHENAESDSAHEGTESSAATIDTANAGKTNDEDNTKPNAIASVLLKVWSAIMIVSTFILSFFAFILKDNSVLPFVVMGVIGLCMPPIVNMFRERARSRQLQEELEERLRVAQLERIKQAREREMERLQRERMLASNEKEIHDAIKNIDVAAYKVNNSME